jgi:hypothetical protein
VTKQKGPTPKRQWQPMERAVPLGSSPEKGVFWKNDRYTVIANDKPDGILWLSIRRNDRKAIRDWRDFQRIKNDIAGDEREAFEMFPAESRLIDTVNQYHLWVLPAGMRLPVGWNTRAVTNENGRYVVNGEEWSDEELAAVVESQGVSPDILTKTRQRPRTEER